VKSFALMAENYNGNAEKQGALSSDIKLMPMATSIFLRRRRAQMQRHKAPRPAMKNSNIDNVKMFFEY
jgi:hypothetical protein